MTEKQLYTASQIAKKIKRPVSSISCWLSRLSFIPKRYNPSRYSKYQLDIIKQKIDNSKRKNEVE